MKHIFIVNPVAGHGRALKAAKIIETICSEMKLDYIIQYTNKEKGSATSLAHYYALQPGPKKIYAVGGDGTVNEVGNGIIGTDAIMGIIAAGSGNDYYKTLMGGKTKHFVPLFKDSMEDVVNVDYGMINDRAFFNIVSMPGIDTEIAEKANFYKEAGKSLLLYPRSIASILPKYQYKYVDLVTDDRHIQEYITLFLVAIGRYYGGGICIAPKAIIDDGKLDVILGEMVSKPKMLFLLGKVMLGSHIYDNNVQFFQTRSLKTENQELVKCNVDGEIITGKKFDISIYHQGLMVEKPNVEKTKSKTLYVI